MGKMRYCCRRFEEAYFWRGAIEQVPQAWEETYGKGYPCVHDEAAMFVLNYCPFCGEDIRNKKWNKVYGG